MTAAAADARSAGQLATLAAPGNTADSLPASGSAGRQPGALPAATNSARRETSAPAAPAAANQGAKALRLNFRNTPLNLVLEYMSDAAGFIINPQTEVRGNVDVWSKEPVTREEAVELLNSVLRKNGYALARTGRILTLVSLAEAQHQDLEVVSGNNPEAVEKSNEVVMQIIPVRYLSAGQLVNNLRPLLPAGASLSVNESANALLLVAAKADIRRTLKIVAALDSSVARVSALKVFQLRYAEAKQLATVVQELFSTPASSQSSGGREGGAQGFLPGGGFGPPGFPQPAGGAGASGEGDAGGAALAKVMAVADESSNSLIVSAPAGSMTAIANLVQQIDQPVSDITELRIFPLANADAGELAEQLSQLFPDNTANSGEQNQMGFRFGGGPPGADPGAEQSNTSERTKKKSRILAVADPRTASLLVSAPSTVLPQIAKLIENLDGRAAGKEKVKVYELQHADPQDVSQVLQDLFNRNTAMRNNSNNRNSLLGQSNPLAARQTQGQNSTTAANSGLGSSGGLGGAGGAGGGGSGGGFQ